MTVGVDSFRGEKRVLNRAGVDRLFAALRSRGYTLIGPRVRDQAIVYDEIESTAELPVGLTDEQDGGRYRLKPRHDKALFGFVVGPHSWKQYLYPPVQKLFSVTRNGQALDFIPAVEPARKLAFVGVRACELAAISVQDRVFIGGPFVDKGYKLRRENVFILAVNCTEPGGTCFCASMETGPRAAGGFDLSLTEIIRSDHHGFVVTVGSALGAEVLDAAPTQGATDALRDAEETALAESAQRMGRSLDTREIKALLYRHYDDKHWNEVAGRCLSCGNCTMVCPTCFCSTVEDTSDLTGEHAERWRKWDSCFNADFSYIHGGVVRSSIRSRYRQWLVHKLGTWHDQFGTSGCVGCGRCITWCPVAIDVTREVAILRENEAPRAAGAREEPHEKR
jgi:ferredoxin